MAGHLRLLQRERPHLRRLVLTADPALVRGGKAVPVGSGTWLLSARATPRQLRIAVQAALADSSYGQPAERTNRVADASALWSGEQASGLHLRRDWLEVAAHDLRAPLGVINAAAAVLQGNADRMDSESIDLLSRVQANGEWTIELLDRILASVRLDQEPERNDEPTAVNALLDGVIKRMAPLADSHGVTLRRMPGAGRSAVQVDRLRVEQVLHNLVANAIRATPAGRAVYLEAKRLAASVSFQVRDEGHGMSPEQIRALREGDLAGTRGAGRGHGLGLAIARAIVMSLGGTLTATSRRGDGTTVRFTARVR